LAAQSVHFTTLESLVGKLGALALAAPGILIKLRRCYKALAGASRSPSTVLRVAGPLRDELRELASVHAVLAGGCGALGSPGAPDNRCLGESSSVHNRS
jgi:hypothetical protein